MPGKVDLRRPGAPCRSLRPWFLPSTGTPAYVECACDCSWTGILAALQEAGPVALVLPGPCSASEAPRVLAAGLALGCDWTLRADVHQSGVDEGLEWTGADTCLRVHALPSSNWRPFDRLARSHRRDDIPSARRQTLHNCVAVPLLVDAEFNLRLLRWSRLTHLDQELARDWMQRTGLRALLP